MSSRIEKKDTYKINHYCMNKDCMEENGQQEATFYCAIERVYLCEKCNEKHSLMTDYIKNHLAT